MFIFLGSCVGWLIFWQLRKNNQIQDAALETEREIAYARLKAEHPVVYAQLEAQKAKRHAEELHSAKCAGLVLLSALALIALMIFLGASGILH